MPAKPITIITIPIGRPVRIRNARQTTPNTPSWRLLRSRSHSGAATARRKASAIPTGGQPERLPGAGRRQASAARCSDATARSANSTAVTAAPKTMTARKGQIRNTKTPGMPVISSVFQAYSSFGHVPHTIRAKTAAPIRLKTVLKVCAAAGRRASRGSMRSSTRVNRPACSVLAICRNTAVTIE